MPDYRTEYQKAYEAIKDAIISGLYAPGERLPQRKLAEQFDTTTISVREALRFLERDGLILFEPKWGATVVELTSDKIYGRYIVREALEGMAARLAAENASAQEKQELTELAEQCDRDLTGDVLSRNEKANLHYALYKKIVETTRCPELIHSITRNNLHTILLSNAHHIDWQHDDTRRHRSLVQIINSGSPQDAEEAMRRHVRDGHTMELKALEAQT